MGVFKSTEVYVRDCKIKHGSLYSYKSTKIYNVRLMMFNNKGQLIKDKIKYLHM